MAINPNYKTFESKGIGEMGEVFRGVKTNPDGFTKTVALKKIAPQYSNQRHLMNLLSSEARSFSPLIHPNVVHILDFFTENGLSCLALEYIDGVNLRDILEACRNQKKTIGWQASMYVAIEVLKALMYMHDTKGPYGSLNIVHRDIHPGNVLISFWGQVKLSDFEMSKVKLSREKTKEQVLSSKFHYTSPEQMRKESATPSSDLFSVGVLLYEMLTLQHPFGKLECSQTLQKIEQHEWLDVSIQLPSLNPELSRIVEKALQKDPRERFESAKEFYDDLSILQDTSWSMHGQELFEIFLSNLIPQENRKQAKINNEPHFIKPAIEPMKSERAPVEKKSTPPVAIALALATFLVGGVALKMLLKKEPAHEASQPAVPVDVNPSTEKPIDAKETEAPNRKDVSTLAAYMGSLEIYGPEGTVITLNGKKMGVLPLETLIVPSRAYLLTMKHKKFGEKTKMINVGNQQAVTISW